MRAIILVGGLVMGLALPGLAEPLTGRAAAAEAFPAGTRQVITSQRLDDRGRGMIRILVPLMERQMGETLDYYGAIAMSPDEGFQSEASQSALNHHSVAAADRAALRACEANRKAGTAPCIVAARIVPQGYAPRDFTLSSNATAALEQTYERARAPKALAISDLTGAYGVGAPEAALQTCARSGARDCRIVVRD